MCLMHILFFHVVGLFLTFAENNIKMSELAPLISDLALI